MNRKKTRPDEWKAEALANKPRGGGYYVLTLRLPPEFPEAGPGSFLMLSVGCEPSILLRRPMAVYDLRRGRAHVRLDILYTVAGRGTRALSGVQEGTALSLLGPLGNTFPLPRSGDRVTVVAGGVGIAPFLLWARKLGPAQRSRSRILLGFRSREQLPLARDFRRAYIRPICAVEGPGAAFRGTAVDLLEKDLEKHRPTRLYACGPEPMMKRVRAVARDLGVPLTVSLEARMACGMGACLSCVTDFVSGPPGARYPLVCQDGPVFEISPPPSPETGPSGSGLRPV